MKKVLTIFTFLILITQVKPLFAQANFRFGLTASPMVSWMKSDAAEYDHSTPRLGVEYGLMVDVGFRNFVLATGAMLTYDGGRLELNDTIYEANDTVVLLPPGSEIKYKFQYITVPVSFKLKTNKLGKFVYFGQFGVSPAVRIRARSDVKRGSLGEIENENLIDPEILPFSSTLMNFGFLFGGGIEYGLGGNTALVLGVIYNSGLANLVDDNDQDKIRLNALALRVGVLF